TSTGPPGPETSRWTSPRRGRTEASTSSATCEGKLARTDASAGSTLDEARGHPNRLRVPGAHGSYKLGERSSERVRDAVLRRDPRGDPTRLDLDERFPVHPCRLGEIVQRASAFVPQARDFDTEGAEG